MGDSQQKSGAGVTVDELRQPPLTSKSKWVGEPD